MIFWVFFKSAKKLRLAQNIFVSEDKISLCGAFEVYYVVMIAESHVMHVNTCIASAKSAAVSGTVSATTSLGWSVGILVSVTSDVAPVCSG